MSNRLTAIYHFLKQQGLGTTLFRARYALAKKSGALKKRFPKHAWDDRPLSYWLRPSIDAKPASYHGFRENSTARFFFLPGQLPAIKPEWLADSVAKADSIRQGRFPYFFWTEAELGSPPRWLQNPFSGHEFDQRHWCEREDLATESGDIKYAWEPARFSWAYTLTRAYAATGDDQYAACFWELLDSWRDANPPQCGPSWQCGQECGLRLMAWVFSLYGLWNAPSTTPERVADLAATIALTAERIEGNIAFARSLANNHTVSEAMALYTVGTLFPEFRQAAHWKSIGKLILDGECISQFYRDGAQLQHSFNYQRFVLQMYAWALCLGRLNSDSFSRILRDALERATMLLWQAQDEHTGRLPNYGSNDGALVLAWNSCDYLDYRPTLGAMWQVLTGRRLYAEGPWDEDLHWLALANCRTQPSGLQRRSVHATQGGYYTLRGDESFALVRCHTYRHRPLQADMLHLDLWWLGQNVLGDSGTYSYNCPQPWSGFFPGTTAHNTIAFNGLDQMEKGARFLWYHWTQSLMQRHVKTEAGTIEYWQGAHFAYKRLAGGGAHYRSVLRLGDQVWIVIDDVVLSRRHRIEQHWNLLDCPYELVDRRLRLDTAAGPVTMILLGDAESVFVALGRETPSPLGWESQHYGERTPRPTLARYVNAHQPVRIATLIFLGAAPSTSPELGDGRLTWSGDQLIPPFDLRLNDRRAPGQPIVCDVRYGELSVPIADQAPIGGDFWPCES